LCWCKKRAQKQALGRSCGGFSTKIHAACDARGNPIRFILTSGEASDYTQALGQSDSCPGRHDADYVVAEILKMEAKVVIPPKSNRKKPRDFDKNLYKERNLIERMFNKLKHFRRVATRYDKTASAFLAFVTIAGIFLWLK
jgi:transposase